MRPRLSVKELRVYTLHIANKNYSSWSLRPWVLMKVLGIPFDEQLTPFLGASGESRSAYRSFSPTGKVPALHDGDVVVWDSLAIAEYIAEKHAGVWPADKKARAFARSVSAEMHSGFQTLRNLCSMNCGIRVELNEVTPALQADIDRLQEIWTTGISQFGGPFLAGSAFGAADAFYCPVAFRMQTYGVKLDAVSQAYVDRLLRLPAMVEWYEAALQETWTEESHEADWKAAGTLKQDLRVG